MSYQEVIHQEMDGSEGRYRPPTAPVRDSRLLEHYRVIGQFLSVAEASSLKVGVPWFPPTKPVRLLRTKLESTVEEYLRSALVTVSTQALESYAEDLETYAPPNVRPALDLYLFTPTFFERYFLATVIFALSALLLLPSIWIATNHFSLSVLVAILAATAFTSIIRTLSSESIRCWSLHHLLTKEILRRQGLDGGDSKIRLRTPAPSPS